MDPIVEEMFQLIKKKVKEQAAYDYDAYAEVIDETIQYFYEKGKLTMEDNEEFIRDQLMQMHEYVQDHSADE